jgi:hypothetical protein
MRPITKEDNAKMLQLGYEELENIEQMALEWFNRAGEIRVEKYIQINDLYDDVFHGMNIIAGVTGHVRQRCSSFPG